MYPKCLIVDRTSIYVYNDNEVLVVGTKKPVRQFGVKASPSHKQGGNDSQDEHR